MVELRDASNAGPPSPCRRECTLDQQEVCVGCGRTLSEICAWSGLDAAGRQRVVDAAALRREERLRRHPGTHR